MSSTGFLRQSVAAVVLRAETDGTWSVLLVRHRFRRGIELPAGRVRGLWAPDGDPETDEEALARQLMEETGQRLARVVAYLGRDVYPDDWECRFYLCDVAPGSALIASGDADQALWGVSGFGDVGTFRLSGDMIRTAISVRCGKPSPAAPWREIRRARQAARRAVLAEGHAGLWAPTVRPPGPPPDHAAPLLPPGVEDALRAMALPREGMAAEAPAADVAPLAGLGAEGPAPRRRVAMIGGDYLSPPLVALLRLLARAGAVGSDGGGA